MKTGAFIVLIALATSIAWCQDSRIRTLLESAERPGEFTRACESLMEIRDSSAQSRQGIVLELEIELKDISNVPAWRSEVSVAGQLQLTELASTIGRSLDRDTRGGFQDMAGLSQRMSLEYDAAVKTLVAFNAQAVPALSEELAKGNAIGRYRAAHALSLIKSAAAETTLRNQYKVDSDIHVKAFIKRSFQLKGSVIE